MFAEQWWAFALAGPVILFLVIVCPVWIVFHYLTVWKRMNAGQEASHTSRVEARDEVVRLRESAARLEERIRTLERILDAEHPHWRSK